MQPAAAGRPGVFDTDAVSWGWFDECGEDQGWFDRDLLVYPAVVPPPPPPPPRPPVPRRQVGSGGGSGGAGGTDWCPPPDRCWPDWLPAYFLPNTEEHEEVEEEADYALVHITEGAVVRAMAAGIIESMIDGKGRQSIVLTADDGTRYWYADIDKGLVKDGARVRHGQPIARAKPNAPTIPTITVGEPKRAELPPAAGDAAELPTPQVGPAPAAPPTPKPAQVVFVEAPPEPIPPPPPARIVRLVRLVPLQQTQPEPPPPEDATKKLSVWVKTGAVAGIVAAILYALSFLKPKLPTPRKKRRKRRPVRRRRT